MSRFLATLQSLESADSLGREIPVQEDEEPEPPELSAMTPKQRHECYIEHWREDKTLTFGDFLRWCYGTPDNNLPTRRELKRMARISDRMPKEAENAEGKD